MMDFDVATQNAEVPARGRGGALARFGLPIAALVVYTFLGAQVFKTEWVHATTYTLGSGGGDAGLFIWFLTWVPHAIAHGVNPFFTTHINYPDGVNVMWNTSLVLPSIILSPLTAWRGPVLTFNVLLLVSLPLSAWTAYLAMRRYVRSHAGAFLGGLLYGFSPYMLAQSRGHVQVILLFFPPLILLLVDEVFVRQRWPAWKAGAVLGLLGALQYLTGSEVFAETALVVVGLLIVLAVQHPRDVASRVPYVLRSAVAGFVTFLVVAGWPLAAQLLGRQRIHGPIQEPGRYVSDGLGFFIPTQILRFVPHSALAIASKFTGNSAERDAYIGIPVVLVALFVTIVWRRRAVILISALMTLGIAVLSLGPHLRWIGRDTGIPMPWRAFSSLPILDSLQPNRLVAFMWLFLGLMIAFLVERAIASSWLRRSAAALVVAVVVLSLWPIYPLGGGVARAPAFFTSASVKKIPQDGVAILVPYASPGVSTPMMWQAASFMRFKMPGGYFIAPGPDGKPHFGGPGNPVFALIQAVSVTGEVPRLSAGSVAAARDWMRIWAVDAVILAPTTYQAGYVRLFTMLLGTPPEPTVGGTFLWRDVRRDLSSV